MSFENQKGIYILCKFLLRILLLLIFILDIFLFQKKKIFYYFLPLNIILLLFMYITSTLKNTKEFLIQKLESRYYKIYLTEENDVGINDIPKSTWEELIDNFGREKYNELSFSEKSKVLIYNNEDPFFDRDYKVKHNPNAIYYNTYVTVREWIEIVNERDRNYDEDNIENSYKYICKPYCHDHIYREYEKEHKLEKFRLGTFWDFRAYKKGLKRKITNIDKVVLGTFEKCYRDIIEGEWEYISRIRNYEKITEYHKKELAKEFDEIMDILQLLFSVLELLEYFENKKKFKHLNITLLVLTLMCWLFILGVSVYVFPPDFQFTLAILHEQYHPQEDPFSMVDIYNNYRGYCLILNVEYINVFYIMYNFLSKTLIPTKICISYILYKIFILNESLKSNNEPNISNEQSKKKRTRKNLGLVSSKDLNVTNMYYDTKNKK